MQGWLAGPQDPRTRTPAPSARMLGSGSPHHSHLPSQQNLASNIRSLGYKMSQLFPFGAAGVQYSTGVTDGPPGLVSSHPEKALDLPHGVVAGNREFSHHGRDGEASRRRGAAGRQKADVKLPSAVNGQALRPTWCGQRGAAMQYVSKCTFNLNRQQWASSHTACSHAAHAQWAIPLKPIMCHSHIST